MGELYIIWNWIREAKNTYESGAFNGMCSALSYMFTNTISIKQRVGQVILNRFGVHTLNKVLEQGLLGNNSYILHALIPEFNFLQMEGDIPRMQKIWGLTSIPPEDFIQWIKEKPT